MILNLGGQSETHRMGSKKNRKKRNFTWPVTSACKAQWANIKRAEDQKGAECAWRLVGHRALQSPLVPDGGRSAVRQTYRKRYVIAKGYSIIVVAQLHERCGSFATPRNSSMQDPGKEYRFGRAKLFASSVLCSQHANHTHGPCLAEGLPSSWQS